MTIKWAKCLIVWEYRYFCADAKEAMTLMGQIGLEGWEVFALEPFIDRLAFPSTRIYAKRAVRGENLEQADAAVAGLAYALSDSENTCKFADMTEGDRNLYFERAHLVNEWLERYGWTLVNQNLKSEDDLHDLGIITHTLQDISGMAGFEFIGDDGKETEKGCQEGMPS